MSNTKAKGQDYVLHTECLDSPKAEIMDITEEWLDTENTDSIHLNVKAANISILTVTNSRPPIRSKEE